MDYISKKWLQYLIYDLWNSNYFIAEGVRKLSFLWWIKLKDNFIFLWRGREISNSDCTKSAFNKSRIEVKFHIQLLVGGCTLASAKGFQNGVKTVLKSQYPLVFSQESSFNILTLSLVSTKRAVNYFWTNFCPDHNTLLT